MSAPAGRWRARLWWPRRAVFGRGALFMRPTLELGRGSVPEDRGVFSGPTPGLFPSAVTASALAILASIRRGFNRVASKGGGEGNGDHLGGRRGVRPRIPTNGRARRPLSHCWSTGFGRRGGLRCQQTRDW